MPILAYFLISQLFFSFFIAIKEDMFLTEMVSGTLVKCNQDMKTLCPTFID